jgi:phosphoglycerate-specific signal transduction histidine kinase
VKITIKARLLLGFGVIVCLLVAASFVSMMMLSGMNERINDIVTVSAEKIKLAARINQNLVEIGRAEKNMILATSQEQMQEYTGFVRKTREEMVERRQQLRELAASGNYYV